ncbi:CAP domain-containing protein [Pseudophaeobacter sp.]|uniref:CAP domain-containing protein n=1 Tax=Pseudophaeobacter sp. TaxID=1971739 RepID=UPI0032976646
MKVLLRLAVCLLLGAAPLGAANADREGAMLGLNTLRAQHGLAPLSWSRKLEKAARRHAKDMERNGFFSHMGSDGSRIADRLHSVGYGFCAAAENIAKGQPSQPMVMASWRQSRGHRKNMLSSSVSEFALVREAGNLWVMVLARPGC